MWNTKNICKLFLKLDIVDTEKSLAESLGWAVTLWPK